MNEVTQGFQPVRCKKEQDTCSKVVKMYTWIDPGRSSTENSEACLLTIKGIPMSVLKEKQTTGSIHRCLDFSSKGRAEVKENYKEILSEIAITDKEEVNEYLGVKIEKQKYGTMKMYQPYLISQILVLGKSKV